METQLNCPTAVPSSAVKKFSALRAMVALAAVVLVAPALSESTNAEMSGQTVPPAKPAAPPTPAAPAPATLLPFPAGATVAYVRLQGVLSNSKFGKCGTALLAAMRTKDQATIAPKQKELQDLQAKIQAPDGTVTLAIMTQMKREADRRQLELQALAQQLQSDEANKQQDLMTDFKVKTGPLIEGVRRDKGLSIILSPDQPGAILAADLALDLTDEVVKRLDVAFPDCAPKAGKSSHPDYR